MDQFEIQESPPLKGTVKISGAKNAALPILISSILNPMGCKFKNVPNLKDVRTTLKLLGELGVVSRFTEEGDCEIDSSVILKTMAPYDLVKTMRASILVLGPLLTRRGEAKVSLPGGCAIGSRPVDYHLMGLKKMGADIDIVGGYIEAKTKPGGLVGAKIEFPFPSVGATENICMAAAMAKGETYLSNAAKEPEIDDLLRVLAKMGATIEGIGTSEIHIQGTKDINPIQHEIMGDRIEGGTFLCGAAINGGEIEILNCDPQHLIFLMDCLKQTGCEIEIGKGIKIKAPSGPLNPISIKTEPYPGFPTDMQAQWMALMTQAKGESLIEECIFENRFMHIPELSRLGAMIKVDGNKARITGTPHQLVGAQLMATDLRASASLILAALVSKGTTRISRIYHMDRGYEKIEKKLSQLGGKIKRVRDPALK